MGEAVEVLLAKLDGRIEGLTQVVELRMQTQERDLESWRASGHVEHQRLAAQVKETAEAVNQLQEFRSKVVGFGLGISVIAGTVSGLLVSLLTGGNGG